MAWRDRAEEDVVSPNGQRFLLDTPIGDTAPPITVILNWKPAV
jgi:hypothetical protein